MQTAQESLPTQIEEGYECDLFFSAAQKQMDQLEADGKLVVEGTRHTVVNNQVVVITLKDSDTAVTGLENLNEAEEHCTCRRKCTSWKIHPSGVDEARNSGTK